MLPRRVQNENVALRSRVAELERDNALLQAKVALLQAKVTFFDRSPWMRDGIRGEQVIAELIGGTMTPVIERYDIRSAAGRVRLEVKYSNLNIAVTDKATRRWQWVRPLGFDKRKSFDMLILVGEADSRFHHLYRDAFSPYVVFEIPFTRVADIVRHSSQMIQISTNPQKARTAVARVLYEEFQTTCDALSAKYRNA